ASLPLLWERLQPRAFPRPDDLRARRGARPPRRHASLRRLPAEDDPPMPSPQQTTAPTPDTEPTMRRAVGRWQLYGLSINDVIGSGIYLLPAAAALLLGPASLWAVLLAGLAVSL